MITAVFLIHDPRWKAPLERDRAFYRTLLKKTLQTTDIPKGKYTATFVLANDAEIKELNKNFRKKNKPTNVLSFPMIEDFSSLPKSVSNSAKHGRPDKVELGDVVLAFETIKHEAKDQKKTFKAHVAHLMVHGLLHLVGFDHIKVKDAEKMEALEIAVLKSAGIKNPYA